MQFTSSERGTRPINIAGISACGGDRLDALLKTISGPIPIDAICGDYLAELNLAWLSKELADDPSKGYEQSFMPAFRLAADKYIELRKGGRDIKIAVNAGGLRPYALAKQLRDFLDTFGEVGKSVKVAWVTGDNVLHQIKDPKSPARTAIKHLSFGTSLEKWGYEPITANAYIGCFGIVESLERGADIVICGRCTDASAAQALSMWWHGWGEQEFDKLALGLITGHLIECGTYVVFSILHRTLTQTGGFFPGFKHIKNYYELGFPIAEVHANGTSVITKQPDQNGIVTVDTVRCQMLYEIQGRYYYNPDVIADLTTVKITAEGPDRVRVAGVKGLPPPESLKVSVLGHGGYTAEINAFAVGLDIQEKAESWARMTRRRFGIPRNGDLTGTKFETFVVQCLGVSEPNPHSQDAATAHVRLFVQARDYETLAVENFKDPVIENLIQAYPGFTPSLEYHRTGLPKPFLAYFPGVLPRGVIEPVKVYFLDSDQVISIPHPVFVIPIAQLPKQQNYEPTDPVDLKSFGETVQIPLGYQVYARSGDKGANVNCGLFPRGDSQEEWDWFRTFMSTKKLIELLGDDAKAVDRIERVEFPEIHAVHFVLVGLLSGGGGGGVSSTTRPDALGKVYLLSPTLLISKGIGEYLRAKWVDYPKKFYDGHENRI